MWVPLIAKVIMSEFTSSLQVFSDTYKGIWGDRKWKSEGRVCLKEAIQESHTINLKLEEETGSDRPLD